MTDSNNGFLSTLLAMQLLSLGILIVALFNAPTLSPTDNSPLDRIEQPLAADPPLTGLNSRLQRKAGISHTTNQPAGNEYQGLPCIRKTAGAEKCTGCL